MKDTNLQVKQGVQVQPKTFVVKIGGSILKSGFPEAFKADLKKLCEQNRVVLVHGGADLVTQTAQKMGLQQKFIVSPDGMRSRYTDRETMDVYTMVMAGKINKQIVASIQSCGIKAVGLSGADGFLLKAVRKKKLIILDERGRKVVIEGGYTGKIESVNTEILSSLLELNYLPVIAPIAIDEEYQLLNVDSDRAAAYIAGSLKADGIIMCTDVEGVMLGETIVKKMSMEEAKKNLELIGHGMKKKVYAAIEALTMGVGEVVITSGLIQEPMTSAINHKAGTLLVSQ